MANKGDIDKDLTFEIDGTDVTPEKFLSGVRAFFGIVNEVTKTVGGKKSAVGWKVQVKAGSNLVGLSANPGFDPVVVRKVADVVASGISLIEQHEEEPAGFSRAALKHLGGLGGVLGKSPKDDTIVRVWVRKEPNDITLKTVAHVHTLLRAEHEDHGSIEGRLQTLSERRNLKFVVYDRLWDKGVTCFIPEELVADAMSNFGARVEVYGMIKYRKDGTPLHISATEIARLPEGSELPSFRDVYGVLRGAA